MKWAGDEMPVGVVVFLRYGFASAGFLVGNLFSGLPRVAFSNPRMSLKSVRAEKGRLQGEDLLSERIEGFERGGGQGGGGSCAHSGRDHEGFLELPLPPPLNVESGAVRPR